MNRTVETEKIRRDFAECIRSVLGGLPTRRAVFIAAALPGKNGHDNRFSDWATFKPPSHLRAHRERVLQFYLLLYCRLARIAEGPPLGLQQ